MLHVPHKCSRSASVSFTNEVSIAVAFGVNAARRVGRDRREGRWCGVVVPPRSYPGLPKRGSGQPLRGAEGVGDRDEGVVVMPAPPGSAFEVGRAQGLFHLAVVALDAPAKLRGAYEDGRRGVRGAYEDGQRGVRGQVGEPEAGTARARPGRRATPPAADVWGSPVPAVAPWGASIPRTASHRSCRGSAATSRLGRPRQGRRTDRGGPPSPDRPSVRRGPSSRAEATAGSPPPRHGRMPDRGAPQRTSRFDPHTAAP